jgi:hypothetical protein
MPAIVSIAKPLGTRNAVAGNCCVADATASRASQATLLPGVSEDAASMMRGALLAPLQATIAMKSGSAGLKAANRIKPPSGGREASPRDGLCQTRRSLSLRRAVVDSAGLADIDLAGLADPAGLADIDLADLADPAGLADIDLADLADPAGLADIDLADLADPADLADIDLADLADPADLADSDSAGLAGPEAAVDTDPQVPAVVTDREHPAAFERAAVATARAALSFAGGTGFADRY